MYGGGMSSISIHQLAVAMCRKNFAELVSYQVEKRSFAELDAAIDAAKRCLQPDIQLEIEEILKNSGEITADRGFWDGDCGKALRFFTSMIERHLSDRFISVTEKELIEIFHIIVMHSAWRARKEPRLFSFLQKKTKRKSRTGSIYPHPAVLSCLNGGPRTTVNHVRDVQFFFLLLQFLRYSMISSLSYIAVCPSMRNGTIWLPPLASTINCPGVPGPAGITSKSSPSARLSSAAAMRTFLQKGQLSHK